MKNSKYLQKEIITVLLLILTLIFIQNNLNPESSEENSFAEISSTSPKIY